MTTMQDLLQQSQVITVVGAGGVGKTSTAAALALAAAQMGRRTLVITIDPARRLANALGLDAFGAEARQIDIQGLQFTAPEFESSAAEKTAPARLDAMMLDLKASWDDMVKRLAKRPGQAQKILANRFYQHLSTELAGAQEYIACEQLYTLMNERDYEVIILDTPPSAQALDFLEAPGRILDLLDDRGLRLIIKPSVAAGRVSLRLFRLSERYLIHSLSKMAGAGMLSELAEFFTLFDGMYEALRDRTRGFQQVFASKKTAFIVVTTAAGHALAEAQKLALRIDKDNLNLGAVVVNQLHQAITPQPVSKLVTALGELGSDELSSENLAQAIGQSCADLSKRAADEAASIQRTLQKLPQGPRYLLPRQNQDVHDLQSLAMMAQQLMQPELAQDLQ